MLRRWILPIVALLIFCAPAGFAEEDDRTFIIFFPIFSYQDSGDKVEFDFLNLGLAELFSYQADEDESELEFLDLTLATLLEIEIEEEEIEIEFLELPLITTFELESRANGNSSLTLADIPFVTLYEQNSSAESLTIDGPDLHLGDFSLLSLFGWGASEEDGTDFRLITLPFLGSVFSCSTGPDGGGLEILFLDLFGA